MECDNHGTVINSTPSSVAQSTSALPQQLQPSSYHSCATAQVRDVDGEPLVFEFGDDVDYPRVSQVGGP